MENAKINESTTATVYNEAGGFEFSYPNEWGNPSIIVSDPSSPNHRSGVKYVYTFYDEKHGQIQLIVNSEDYAAVGQSGAGLLQISPAATRDMILEKMQLIKDINSDNDKLFRRRKDSFLVIRFEYGNNIPDKIYGYRIVDLPKVKASAVMGEYSLLIEKEQEQNCAKGDLSPSTKEDICLTQKKADQLEATLASFKPHASKQ